jgi:RNA polymerase sigma factor (TIGR02999 family)
MAPDPSALATITTWLVRWREGDGDALSHLTTLIYAELHRLASIFFSDEREGHTLQPTALVHELYVRLNDVQGVDWKCRSQFLAMASGIMRHILVDHARKRNADKRGGGEVVALDEGLDTPGGISPDLVGVDVALGRFTDRYPRQARVVELRFFGGLRSEEIVEALNGEGYNTSLRTVERDWRFSKAWLQNELERG